MTFISEQQKILNLFKERLVGLGFEVGRYTGYQLPLFECNLKKNARTKGMVYIMAEPSTTNDHTTTHVRLYLWHGRGSRVSPRFFVTLEELEPKIREIQNNPKDHMMYCPNCGLLLQLKSRRLDGHKFWGCPGYPKCNKIISIESEFLHIQGKLMEQTSISKKEMEDGDDIFSIARPRKDMADTSRNIVSCPSCGSPMVLRTPKHNQSWKPFFGCSNFRHGNCDATRDLKDPKVKEYFQYNSQEEPRC